MTLPIHLAPGIASSVAPFIPENIRASEQVSPTVRRVGKTGVAGAMGERSAAELDQLLAINGRASLAAIGAAWDKQTPRK